MTTPHRIRTALLGLAAIAAAAAAPASARAPASDVETTTIRVARPASSSPAAMRQVRRRIATAALEACGASPFSAVEVRAAVARSTCWRQGYDSGVAQLGAAVAALPPARADRMP